MRSAASVKEGSLLTFAAFAHETNVKPEGEWRLSDKATFPSHSEPDLIQSLPMAANTSKYLGDE